MHRKSLGFMSVDFDAIGQLVIIYTVFVKHLIKNGNTMRDFIR